MNAPVRILKSSMTQLPEARAWSVMTSPQDVLAHRSMTKAEKRLLLAAWASDAHAVEDAPSLRRWENGVIANVDDILLALKALDEDDDPPPPPAASAAMPIAAAA